MSIIKGSENIMSCLVPDTSEIMEAVYQVLTCDHYGLIEKVSDLTGYPYQTIVSRINGRVATFDDKSLNILRAAHYLTNSSRLQKILLWPGLRATQEPSIKDSGKSIEADLGDCHLALSTVHGKLREATDTNSEGGQKMTLNEIKDIERAIVEFEKELADVKGHLKRAKDQSAVRELRAAK